MDLTPQNDNGDPRCGLPNRVDVAVIGSGYTGLNAALETVRGGRSTLVLDAEQAGWGCSSRNGGQISTSIKPSIEKLARKFGIERAIAIHKEGHSALNWIGDFIQREGIECDFGHVGRFHAAHTPQHYERLAQDAKQQAAVQDDVEIIPRSEQRQQLGTDAYFGGALYKNHASLHPAKYHRGLLQRVLDAGAQVMAYTPVLQIEKTKDGFVLTTNRGSVIAKDVVIATNGYSGKLLPWLRRRVIPIGSYMIATEELPESLVDTLFPQNRIAGDTCRVVYYFRASPDRRRVVFGGRVSAGETDPKISAPALYHDMTRIFPELRDWKVSHSWAGTVAYSFDTLAHCGRHDGMHYAASYCGSGVSMSSYLGMRTGQRILGLSSGKTAFDDLPFPTRPLYYGTPWFLPATVAWYRWLDTRASEKAKHNANLLNQ
ncbi:MAG: FAD-binding oxidoreductase [Alphaproteobacteria bacterium]|nr:FAD-binding oxidoreductase [Alphaproteobacteria bacterium]